MGSDAHEHPHGPPVAVLVVVVEALRERVMGRH